MSRAGSQKRTLLGILALLRPASAIDASFPSRIDQPLRSDRRLGSRDRRLYRALIYTWLRYLPWTDPLLDSNPDEAIRRIAWLSAGEPAADAFREAVADGLPTCPPGADQKARILGADPALLTPAWLAAECPGALLAPLRDALLSRAPLWIRVQSDDRAAVEGELTALGLAWKPSPFSAAALRLPVGTDLSRSEPYLRGRIEIQDVGSQRVLIEAGVEPGGHWLDACAGAGGKTLQVASMLGSGGRVTARDRRPEALQELMVRATRAGLSERISVGTEDPAGGFDGVLVDAPCSGSGTLRRSPHLRWSNRAEAIERAARLQSRLLRENAESVRPGGKLVYATCSLCRSENEGVTRAFLESKSDFEEAAPGRLLPPQEHDGDGFFVATFRRKG